MTAARRHLTRNQISQTICVARPRKRTFVTDETLSSFDGEEGSVQASLKAFALLRHL